MASRALPRFAYGDPAGLIEALEIREKGCRICVRSVSLGERTMCLNNLKFPRCMGDKRNGHKLTPEAGG